MIEKRNMERRHIMFYSRVFDRKTGKMLGYLGNITTKGMMIISEEPIPKLVEFKLRMDLPDDLYQKPVLFFKASSLWCEPDIDPNFYNTGFKLRDVPRSEQEIIEKIQLDFEMRS